MASRGLVRGMTKHAKKVMDNLIDSWKIFRGDQVMVTAGKDKGQVGTVSKVYRKENRLIVQGLNLVSGPLRRGCSCFVCVNDFCVRTLEKVADDRFFPPEHPRWLFNHTLSLTPSVQRPRCR